MQKEVMILQNLYLADVIFPLLYRYGFCTEGFLD